METEHPPARDTVRFGDPPGEGDLLTDAPSEVRFLDPAALDFERTPGGILRLFLPDRCYPRVAVLRVLPLTSPDGWLSLRAGDEEIGILRDLGALPLAARQLVEEDLQRRYFRPVILRVTKLAEAAGNFRWQVETDRGPFEFVTQHPRQSCLPVGDSHYIVTDIDNNRYEITEAASLDRRTRTYLLPLLG